MSMKQNTTNTFDKGLNVDLHPIVTPNSVLTDNLNGTLITYNGNEFSLQNDKGNKKVASLTNGYVPIGAKEHNGIIYIVSVKNEFVKDSETGEYIKDENDNYIVDLSSCKTEIGTYPGIDWNVEKEKEFDLQYDCYTPLCNFKSEGQDDYGAFTDVSLGYSTLHPVTIEIQPSYDGSVNIIITDGVNPVRIVNSAFSVLPNDKYKLIQRNQTVYTNYYSWDSLRELELIRNSATLANVRLDNVGQGGQLKGGNYTFYIKFGDSDYNQTDVVAESGIVSIFKGSDGDPFSIKGTLYEERTDKSITLTIENCDYKNFSKIYVYYVREYSDTQGFRLSESVRLIEPFDLNGPNQTIFITGYEQTALIDVEELNIDYHTFDNARAMAQQQSMLFLGNLNQKDTFKIYQRLADKTKLIVPRQVQNLELEATNTKFGGGSEYYSTQNIYNYVGYWPDEYYRFGIVYILSDGSTTRVFNTANDGVVKTSRVAVLGKDVIKPISFVFDLSGIDFEDIPVIGYFVVRQKRIPMTICQGLSIAVDQRTHLPVTWNGANWITESFLSCNRDVAYWDCDNGTHDGQYSTTLNYVWSRRSHQDKSYNKSWDPIVEIKYTNSSVFKNVSDNAIPKYLWSVESDPTEVIWWQQGQNSAYVDWFNGYGLNHTGYIGTNVEDAHFESPSDDNFFNTVFITKYHANYKYNALTEQYEEINNGANDITFITRYYPREKERDITSAAWWYQDIVPDETIIHIGNPSDYDLTSDLLSGLEDRSKFISYGHTPLTASIEDRLNGSGLLCTNAMLVPSVKNVLDGSKFVLRKEYSVTTSYGTQRNEYYSNTDNWSGSYLLITEDIKELSNDEGKSTKCVYVPSYTKAKTVDSFSFSTVAGDEASPTSVVYPSEHLGVDWAKGNDITTVKTGYVWCGPVTNAKLNQYESGSHKEGHKPSDYEPAGFNCFQNINVVRGLFTPFVGLATNDFATDTESKMGVYSIRVNEIDDNNNQLVRKQDESPYFTVGPRTKITEPSQIYRGDCFTCTVGNKILTNFVDSNTPVAEVIIDPNTWRWAIQYHKYDPAVQGDNHASGINNTNKINSSDINNINLGYWVTYKCLSSYNLGIRSEDSFNTEEMALLGSPRSFFPVNGGSTSTGNKVPESELLNDGYSATVGQKRFILYPEVPYKSSEFANRIIFSNVQLDNSYSNGYRVFQGESFRDYDKQYGEIVKLIPFNDNLLCVMEHGIGLVGINEQALLQTNTSDTIHFYGKDLVSEKMQIISPDFGTKYEHSVIHTPLGVYGIDTDARKVWRVGPDGFKTISDARIQSYLNDELGTNKSVDLPLFDVRTHYNAAKGDLMFTFFKKLFKTKPVEQLEPRTENIPADKKYFNINTSNIVLSVGETVTRSFNTNLSESEVSMIVKNSNIVNAALNFENKTITITGSEAGGTQVEIAGKLIETRVKSEEEENADRQHRISDETGTNIIYENTSEIDPETGEEVEKEVPTIVSKLIITSGPHSFTFYVGETYSIPINFRNNPNNVTLADCQVVSEFENGGDARFVKSGNNLLITPLSAGRMRYGVHYGTANGFDVDWITLVNKKFYVDIDGRHENGDVVDVSAAEGTYFEVIGYGENSGTVTFTEVDNEIVDCEIREGMQRVIVAGKSPGQTSMTITDTGSGDSVTINFHVLEHINITDAEFYTIIDEHNTKITSLTMTVGETKRVTWKYLPNDYHGNTNVISTGFDSDHPDVYDRTRYNKIQVANASYSLGGRYTDITAKQAGTINWHVDISDGKTGRIINLVILPIRVNDTNE